MKLRFGRLPLHFDAAALQRDLLRLQRLSWPAHFNTGYHDGGWSGIALVSDDGDARRLYGDPTAKELGRPTAALSRCPALQAVIEALPAPVQSARLLRLAAGSIIREHRDHGLGVDLGLVRLHVPIVSHPAVEFHVDGVRIPMSAGECWYLDLGLPHRVSNPSPHERVHLVVDCRVNDALKALLPAAADSEREVRMLLATAPETAEQRFDRFRKLAIEDPALLAELRHHTDIEVFLDAVARAGSERGYHFSAEDVRAVLHAGRRAWLERGLY
jgi:hypothetical protein